MKQYLIRAEIMEGKQKGLLDIIQNNDESLLRAPFLKSFLEYARVKDGIVRFGYTSLNQDLSEEERKRLEKYFRIRSITLTAGYITIKGERLADYLVRQHY